MSQDETFHHISALKQQLRQMVKREFEELHFRLDRIERVSAKQKKPPAPEPRREPFEHPDKCAFVKGERNNDAWQTCLSNCISILNEGLNLKPKSCEQSMVCFDITKHPCDAAEVELEVLDKTTCVLNNSKSCTLMQHHDILPTEHEMILLPIQRSDRPTNFITAPFNIGQDSKTNPFEEREYDTILASSKMKNWKKRKRTSFKRTFEFSLEKKGWNQMFEMSMVWNWKPT
ncbi:hypothetical protein ABFX02_07G109200 [Erythranthe guttata]